ncbi:MAG: tetratricopeptide repeat protein, partial [Kiritimatiellae bacterium]|nr:tetratricopeptide repeat protein [Kiritimatiellia bacterium]
MKYYDDDYEDEAAYPDKDETVRKPEIQLESLRGLDWLLALILAGIMGGLLTLWALPGLSPDAWSEVAIGAGLSPMKAIFPGFWNAIVRGLYSLAGIPTGTLLIKILGRVVAGMSVGLVYLLLRQILSITIRVRLQFSRRRFFVVRGVAVLGAIFFACSDPIWRAGQAFTPPLLLLFLTILVLTLFFSFLMSGGMKQIYLSMFILGLLSAETPMGFFLLALVWGVYLLALRHGAVAADSPILNPIVEQSSKWHLTFLYVIGLVIGVAVNCSMFIVFDGLAVFEKVGADVPLIYATHWWTQFIHAASGLGWALAVGIGMLPFLVSAVLLPRAVDEEQFLPYHMGAVFFVAGALSFAQLAELPPLWFWTWSPAARINSDYFLLVLMLFSAASVVFSLAVMAVDICCRDHKRLAMQRFAELKDEMDVGKDEPADMKPLGAGAWIVLCIVPTLLLAGVVPGRQLSQTRRMLSIVNDYVDEVLAECGNAKWIFTDGSFDQLLELRASAQGRSIRAISMMAGNTPREQYIRTVGVTNQEDRIALSIGAPMALRTWMHDHPDRLSEVAIQLGFELWKRDGKELPPCSGVLSRPAGMSEEERQRGVTAATELADRILDIYADGGPSKSAGTRVNELFLFVQWRISRLARMRAEREDRAGNTNLAMKDVSLSDRLDHNNASLNRILRDMDKARERTLRSVTPRESLQMALARADFTLARRFAEPILQGDPDDPNANFGVGMSYFTQKQWARAEEFLRKCLIKKPKEPAVWNNLAMICLYTERYDEGLKLAHKALELIPESAEVKDTIKQIKEAKEKAKEEAGKAKKTPAEKPAEAQPPPPAATNAPAKAEVKPVPANTPKPAAAKTPPAAKPAATNAPAKAKGPSPLRMASPREQLEQAIGRGDYVAAAKFAAPILRTNPDDAYANFAVGMDHFGKQAWDRAVTHLTRCVKQSPDEPVFLNNLAIALLYKGRYDEALKHAQKALKIQPDSEVVQDTINQIKKARAVVAAKKPDSKKKPAEKKPAGKKAPKKAEKTEEPPKPA